MNIHPQIIVKNEVPEFVVLPYDEYKNMLIALEEQEDSDAIKEFYASDQQTIPLQSLRRIADGEHPVRVFRELRGLSQAELSRNVGITRQYLHQIENKQRKGNARVLKIIAGILEVELDLLVV